MSASSKKKLRKEQNAAALTEKQLQQQKEAKKLKGQTITFVVIIALVLAIGLGSLAVTAYKNSGIIERNSTAVTIGEHKLSAADLGYFYLDVINTTYRNWEDTYGENTAAYLSLFQGLDLTKPLDEQLYDKEKNITFAQYFIDTAIQKAINVYAMYDLAVASGEISDEDIESMVDSTVRSLKASGKSQGYVSFNRFLKSFYGNGATEKSFRRYVELVTIADTYSADAYDSFTYTDSDLAAYNEEHFDEFSSFSYASFYVSVNDLLVCTADESDTGHQHTQEEQSAALVSAEKVIDAIKNAKVSSVEDLNKFLRTLDAYKDDEDAICAENEDVLYSSIPEEDMAKWLADSSRKVGDLTVFTKSNESTNELGHTVSTPYGFDVILYLGRNDNEMKLVNVRHILKAFTDGVTDAQGNTNYPSDSIAKAKSAVESLKDTWVNGGMGEEAFAELVLENTDDGGSALTGGLYEMVYPGQMVAAFNDWCFDEARQPGDYEIVETEYGYHLMYFSGHCDVTFRNFMIENTMHNNDYNEWYQEQINAVKYTVNDTSKLKTDITLNSY